jgi:hypothetical protein
MPKLNFTRRRLIGILIVLPSAALRPQACQASELHKKRSSSVGCTNGM